MKPFITEYDLIHLQHTENVYKNNYQADIFLDLLGYKEDLSIKDFSRFLYHRLVDENNNIWEIKFPDNSFCLLKMSVKGHYVKGFAPFDYYDNINRFFDDVPN